MTLSEADVERIVNAAATMDESLSVLADKQSLSRSAYRTDQATRDIVERRFIKVTEAAQFRNVLAHTDGEAVDHDEVYDALQDLERYRNFLHEVRTYLDETGALDS